MAGLPTALVPGPRPVGAVSPPAVVEPAPRGRHRRPRGRRRTAHRLGTLALLALLAAAWPTTLGGRVAYVGVDGISMLPTYRSGDLVVTWAEPSYRVGDPIVYRVPTSEVGAGAAVVHRVVTVRPDGGMITRGDHNKADDPWTIRTGDVTGRVLVHVPRLGGWLVGILRPLTLGLICGGATTVALWPRNRTSRTRAPGPRRARRRA